MEQISLNLKDIELGKNPIRAELGDLTSLMQSIRQSGLINPLTVRRMKDGAWELVSGYRRFHAMQKLGMPKATVHVVEANDVEALVINIAENATRKDVTVAEEGYAYLNLIKHGLTPQEISARTGVHTGRIHAAMDIVEKIPSRQLKGIVPTTVGMNNAKGQISYPMALQAISLQREFSLKPNQMDRLLTVAKKSVRNRKDLRKAAMLVSQNATERVVKKRLDATKTISFSIAFDARKLESFLADQEWTSAPHKYFQAQMRKAYKRILA